MARLTKVGVTPAEPLRDGAAELTFEIDKVCTMLRAVSISDTKLLCGAFRAHKILRFKFLRSLLCLYAIFHTTKVWLLTFEALVICKLEDGPSLQVVIVYVVWIL